MILPQIQQWYLTHEIPLIEQLTQNTQYCRKAPLATVRYQNLRIMLDSHIELLLS